MNEEKNNKRMFYVIMGIALTLVLGIGVSFAVFTAQANRNVNLVTTGTLQIRYTEGSTITADNLKPATVEQVKEAYTHGSCIYAGDRTTNIQTEKICAYKTFTITNIGSLTAYTRVILEDITNTYQNLKYQLFETTPATLSGINLLNTTELVNNIELLPNGNKTYTLLIWLDESATIETDQNKSYTAKITASAITTTNKNLDESGANAPVLADGMIPITYNRCGDIALPSQETYPQCYNETYVNNINSADRAALIDMCVDDVWFNYDLEEQCEMEMDYIISTGESYFWPGDTLEAYIGWLEEDDYVITSKPSYAFFLENFYTVVKADSNNIDIPYQWYDYDNKQWANAVMVSSATRDTYMTADIGTPVEEADILAYYVWIPRYKYQLFNIEFDGADVIPQSAIINENNAINTLEYKNDITIHLNQVDLNGYEQLINVVFEKGTETTGTVRCSVSEIGVETCTNKANGNWYTHPAFTFGEDELEGIWIGKFETTYGTNTTDVYPDNTVYETPTIKPNVTSLRNQQISKQFETAQYFGTSAYLTNDGASRVDAHMMKNIEWGAVAYLKQSNYGLGTTDIALNSNYVYLTGCGPQSAGSEDYGSICNAYDTTLGISASTTGNITGVYDMAGGAFEYTMGVVQDNTTTGRSPMADDSRYTAFPESKYYDLYAYGTSSTSQTAYNRSHLGDATGETRSWYGDEAYFPSAFYPWSSRGGLYFAWKYAGVFSFSRGDGNANTNNGFRVALSTTGA